MPRGIYKRQARKSIKKNTKLRVAPEEHYRAVAEFAIDRNEVALLIQIIQDALDEKAKAIQTQQSVLKGK